MNRLFEVVRLGGDDMRYGCTHITSTNADASFSVVSVVSLDNQLLLLLLLLLLLSLLEEVGVRCGGPRIISCLA